MLSYKFGKDKKILSSDEYNNIFATKQVLRGKYFQVIYKRTHNISKLGLAITKKNHKLAVERNRLKRLIREVFRHSLLKNLNIIIINKKFTNISNNKLRNDLKNLITQLK